MVQEQRRIFVVQGYHHPPKASTIDDRLKVRVNKHQLIRNELVKKIIIREGIEHYFIDGQDATGAQGINVGATSLNFMYNKEGDIERLDSYTRTMLRTLDPEGFIDSLGYCRKRGVNVQVMPTERRYGDISSLVSILEKLDRVPNKVRQLITLVAYSPELLCALLKVFNLKTEREVDEYVTNTINQIVPPARRAPPNYFLTAFNEIRDDAIYQKIFQSGINTSLLFMGSGHHLLALYNNRDNVAVYGLIICDDTNGVIIKTNQSEVPQYFPSMIEKSIGKAQRTCD